MSFLGAIIKTVTLPVDIVLDVVTLGGTLTGKDKTFTEEKLDSIEDEIE